MKLYAFRAPIDISQAPMSRVRVGATISENTNQASAPPPNPPPPAPAPNPMAQTTSPSTMSKATSAIGGYSFPLEVSIATAAGGAVGLFMGGWMWGLLGAVGSNLAGRLGASYACKNAKNAPGGVPSYAKGKCGCAQGDPNCGAV